MMLSKTLSANLPCDTSAQKAFEAMITVDKVLGVAIFDTNGLPREYYVTVDFPKTTWVPMVFQALGLQSLLTSSLQLEGFRHICITTQEHYAFVVRHKHQYTAILVDSAQIDPSHVVADALFDWVSHFEENVLRRHERFEAS